MDRDGDSDTGETVNSFTLLRHPSGAPVYVVGTAHVSKQAVQDVVTLINKVNPTVIVLELDEERERKLVEQMERGDTYGIQKIRGKSTWDIVKMSLSGEVLPFMLSAIYTVTGAVMGTTPGGEFLAAIQAAQTSGAQIVLGDRSQDATMKRLQYYTRYLSRQDSRRQADMRRMQRMMDQTSGEGGGPGPRFSTPTDTTGAQPDFMRREPPPTHKELEVEQEVRQTLGAEDQWGLGPDDNSEAGMRRRLLEMMREGGCRQPNQVLEAAKRLLQDGLDPKGSIKEADVLTVRECGNSLVESFRQRALKGDATWMQRLEQEQVAGAKGAAGMELSNAAMKKVIVDERDVILARRLWEAGQEAGTQPVVGVVGAGHIKGIAHYWPEAGSPAIEARMQQYMQSPEEDEGAPWLTALAGGVVLGTIAYRRPKAAALFAGAMALATAPYLGFMVVTVNRFSKFASKLVGVAETMDASGFGGEGGLGSWGAEGSNGGMSDSGEWQ